MTYYFRAAKLQMTELCWKTNYNAFMAVNIHSLQLHFFTIQVRYHSNSNVTSYWPRHGTCLACDCTFCFSQDEQVHTGCCHAPLISDLLIIHNLASTSKCDVIFVQHRRIILATYQKTCVILDIVVIKNEWYQETDIAV